GLWPISFALRPFCSAKSAVGCRNMHVLMTVIIPFVGDYYFSPALIGMIIIFVATMGFILPGSSGMAPYLYGNDWIQVRDIYRYGLFYCLLFLICSVLVYLAASFII
ncbi:hypothetical protein AALB51_23735, partial [Lachnospiraceae bacterium 62-26]